MLQVPFWYGDCILTKPPCPRWHLIFDACAGDSEDTFLAPLPVSSQPHSEHKAWWWMELCSMTGGKMGWRGAQLSGDRLRDWVERDGEMRRELPVEEQYLVVTVNILASIAVVFIPQTRSCLTRSREAGTGCDKIQLPLATVRTMADLNPYTQCCSFISTSCLVCLAGLISFCKTAAERKQT